MPYFETDRLSVHFTDTGCGETVVLLHAGATSSAHWRKVTPLLSDHYRFLAPDLIGFGETKFRDGRGDASHDDQADLVRALLEHTGQELVHVVGHSFGGSTAMCFTVRNPEVVKSQVLIEPVLIPLLRHAGENELYEKSRVRALAFIHDAQAGRNVAAWRRFIDGHNGDGTWDSLSDHARVRFLDVTPQTAAAHKANLNSPTDLVNLAELTIPTKVICGEKTNDSFRRICRIVREHVPGCDYETIIGAAHMSPLTHVEPVVTAINGHLEMHRSG